MPLSENDQLAVDTATLKSHFHVGKLINNQFLASLKPIRKADLVFLLASTLWKNKQLKRMPKSLNQRSDINTITEHPLVVTVGWVPAYK